MEVSSECQPNVSRMSDEIAERPCNHYTLTDRQIKVRFAYLVKSRAHCMARPYTYNNTPPYMYIEKHGFNCLFVRRP